MDEEMKFRLGLDTKPIEDALEKFDDKLDHIKETAIEKFKEMGKELAVSLGAAGAFAILERTLQKVKDINRAAESIGVSTDFIQNIRNVGEASGLSAEQLEKALDKFAKGLPNGSDVEEQFYKIADAISKTEDPVTRVHMAIDAFGQKLGVQMIPMLARGADGIRALAGEFDKLTESEMRNLEETHVQMEKISNTLTVWAGKAIAAVQNTVEMLATSWMSGVSMQDVGAMMGREAGESELDRNEEKKNIKEAQAIAKEKAKKDALEKAMDEAEDLRQQSIIRHGTPDEKLAALDKEKAKAQAAQFLSQGDEVEILKWKEKELEVDDQILQIQHQKELSQKRQRDHQKRLTEEIRVAQREIEKTERHMARTAREPAMHSIEELASQPMQFWSNLGWVGGPGVMAARGIMSDRERAHQAALAGNYDLADFYVNRADYNFKGLAQHDPFLKNPFDEMNETLKTQNEHLENIEDRLDDLADE